MKPMLAATLESVDDIIFPCIVSPKLDGLRCIVHNGVALSRNLKPFRNAFVQRELGNHALNGLDGELIVGSPTGPDVLGATQSGIMSFAGEPDFTFHVFDNIAHGGMPFLSRLISIQHIKHRRVAEVVHRPVHTLEDFLALEAKFLTQGFEGIMIRHPDKPYKFGRSTLNEFGLVKFKRFTDSEGTVLSIEEGVINQNEAVLDALGHTKRSMVTENMVPSGKVGTLIVQDRRTNETIRVSPGRMVHSDREYYLKNPHKIIGHMIKYKWFDYNTKDAPRFATFQAFRSVEDL